MGIDTLGYLFIFNQSSSSCMVRYALPAPMNERLFYAIINLLKARHLVFRLPPYISQIMAFILEKINRNTAIDFLSTIDETLLPIKELGLIFSNLSANLFCLKLKAVLLHEKDKVRATFLSLLVEEYRRTIKGKSQSELDDINAFYSLKLIDYHQSLRDTPFHFLTQFAKIKVKQEQVNKPSNTKHQKPKQQSSNCLEENFHQLLKLIPQYSAIRSAEPKTRRKLLDILDILLNTTVHSQWLTKIYDALTEKKTPTTRDRLYHLACDGDYVLLSKYCYLLQTEYPALLETRVDLLFEAIFHRHYRLSDFLLSHGAPMYDFFENHGSPIVAIFTKNVKQPLQREKKFSWSFFNCSYRINLIFILLLLKILVEVLYCMKQYAVSTLTC